MATTGTTIPLRQLLGSRYGALLAALLLLLVLAPFVDRRVLASGLNDVLLCGVLTAGLYAATGLRRSLLFGLLMAVPVLATHRLASVVPYRAIHALHYALTIALLAYATRTILLAILVDSRVTIETIKGAICVYLLLGLTWAYLDAVIDLVSPNSFRFEVPEPTGDVIGHALVTENMTKLIYFSFCTLTTLGYGDIYPASAPARTFAYLEAIVGQVYLTVLVARLVGMHISQPPPEGRA